MVQLFLKKYSLYTVRLLIIILIFLFSSGCNQRYQRYLQEGLELGDVSEQAIKKFDKAIKLNPNDSIYAYRGNVKFHIDNWHGSIDDFTNAIELNPKKEYYLMRAQSRGLLLIKGDSGQYAPFIKDLSMVIDHTTKNARLLQYRGTVYLSYNEKEKGCADLRRAYQLDKNILKDKRCDY